MQKITTAVFAVTSAGSVIIAGAAVMGLVPSAPWVLPSVLVWAFVHMGTGYGLALGAQGH